MGGANNSTEDYLKCILILGNKRGHVRATDIASELGVTRPSVSAAMKKLKELKYIYADKDGGIRLTEEGRRLAEKVNNKHRLLTGFLTKIGVDEKTAVKEACLIEHAIGEETYERLEEFYERGLSGD